MREAIKEVRARCSANSLAYSDEGHIFAVALLYDTAEFTYLTHNKSRYVRNELGSRGYICLLHLLHHFDVLLGIDGPPIIPHAIYTWH